MYQHKIVTKGLPPSLQFSGGVCACFGVFLCVWNVDVM